METIWSLKRPLLFTVSAKFQLIPVLAKAPPGLRLAILQARQIKILG
jgi:hypothetical protein